MNAERNEIGDLERKILGRLGPDWKKAKSLGLVKDARRLIRPLLHLADLGMLERRKEGREYFYRRKDAPVSDFSPPAPEMDEEAPAYARRAGLAYREWLEAQRDPLPDLVHAIVLTYFDTPDDEMALAAAVEVLRRWLDEKKSH